MIDVSGSPPNDIYIGVILIKHKDKYNLLYHLNKNFQRLFKFSEKASNLDGDYLFDVLRFFDKYGLKMVTYQFKDFQWRKHQRKLNELFKEKYPHHKYRHNFTKFQSRIIGALYYHTINEMDLKGKDYHVTVCIESHLDIWSVLDTVNRLSKRDSSGITINVNIRRIEHLLKIADLVAGSSRKVDNFKLKTLKNHTILRNPINDDVLRFLFNI